MIRTYLATFLIMLLLSSTSFAQSRQIALTIDDLPFVGEQKSFHLNMIVDVLKANKVPATGFVIGNIIRPENRDALLNFREAGLGLGNHTWSHKGLNQRSAESYIDDINMTEKAMGPLLSKPKYFRYPYLDMGQGETKKIVREYLHAKHYHIVPVTIDSKDFIFNQLLLSVPEINRRQYMQVLMPCYLEFLWQQTLQAEEHNLQTNQPDQPQILLIHANLLNAYGLEDIISFYRSHGYQFVSLKKALKPSVFKRSGKGLLPFQFSSDRLSTSS